MIDAETARKIAVEKLRELGGDQGPVLESWLIKDGYIVGRRFWAGTMSVVWLIETGEVTVCGQGGKVLKIVAVNEMKKAA